MNTTDPPCFYGRAEACPCCGAWRQRARELEKLAYLGEHHFPDLTYKARLEELVPQLRAAEARVRELERELEAASTSCSPPKLSEEARAARAPRPPEELVGAFHGVETMNGCGDHSCVLAPPRGMGTNGGCRCDERALRRGAMQLRARVADLERTAHAAEDMRDAYAARVRDLERERDAALARVAELEEALRGALTALGQIGAPDSSTP